VGKQYCGARKSQATGVAVTSVTTRVGRAVPGGTWELAGRAGAALPQPPLTAAGMARYAGVLSASEITVTGTLHKGETTRINSVSLTIKVRSVARSCAVGTFDSSGNFEPSTFLRVTNAATGPAPSGAVGR
jgi:collagen type VII alpha